MAQLAQGTLWGSVQGGSTPSPSLLMEGGEAVPPLCPGLQRSGVVVMVDQRVWAPCPWPAPGEVEVPGVGFLLPSHPLGSFALFPPFFHWPHLTPTHTRTSSLADERDRVQKKTFTKWVNKHLFKVSPPFPGGSRLSQGQLREDEGQPPCLHLSQAERMPVLGAWSYPRDGARSRGWRAGGPPTLQPPSVPPTHPPFSRPP